MRPAKVILVIVFLSCISALFVIDTMQVYRKDGIVAGMILTAAFSFILCSLFKTLVKVKQ